MQLTRITCIARLVRQQSGSGLEGVKQKPVDEYETSYPWVKCSVHCSVPGGRDTPPRRVMGSRSAQPARRRLLNFTPESYRTRPNPTYILNNIRTRPRYMASRQIKTYKQMFFLLFTQVLLRGVMKRLLMSDAICLDFSANCLQTLQHPELCPSRRHKVLKSYHYGLLCVAFVCCRSEFASTSSAFFTFVCLLIFYLIPF